MKFKNFVNKSLNHFGNLFIIRNDVFLCKDELHFDILFVSLKLEVVFMF